MLTIPWGPSPILNIHQSVKVIKVNYHLILANKPKKPRMPLRRPVSLIYTTIEAPPSCSQQNHGLFPSNQACHVTIRTHNT